MKKSVNRLALAVAAMAWTAGAMTGCANMNNAQTGAAGGAVAGAGAGWLASLALCKNNDVACRNRYIAAGTVAGAAVGYLTGYEKDLKIAEQAAADLRLQGYDPQVETKMVEADVPYDLVTEQEIGNEQLPTYEPKRVGHRKKQVKALSKMTVKLKSRNDPAERANVTGFLLARANQMSGRQELVIPAEAPRNERIAITQFAREKNVLVRETRGANAISLASL